MSNLYREEILDHYKNPRNFGALKDPDKVGKGVNSFCGDEIEIQIKLDENSLIEDVKFSGQGCAVSTASASMLTEKIKGQSLAEVKKISKEDVIEMLGIDLSPTRLKCALLPLNALQQVGGGD